MALDLLQWGNAYYNTTVCGRSEYVRNQVFCWDAECNVIDPDEQCFDMEKSKIMCQHGDMECLGNLIESCAAVLATGEPNRELASYNFHNCSSTAYQKSWRTNQELMEKGMFACAREIGYSFAANVQECYDRGQKDGRMWQMYAKATISLGSARSAAPYTLINGKALADDTTVIQAVCDAYDGVKPPVCSSSALYY